jgi:hypothetical protein
METAHAIERPYFAGRVRSRRSTDALVAAYIRELSSRRGKPDSDRRARLRVRI